MFALFVFCLLSFQSEETDTKEQMALSETAVVVNQPESSLPIETLLT